MSEHRMQHPEGPTWCKDCGRFDFACEGIECPAPGSGNYDQTSEAGFRNIERCLRETFPQDDASDAEATLWA